MKTLAVLGSKGGVGKTSVAVNLAAAMANQGNRVVLVDADSQGGATSHLGVLVGDTPGGTASVLLGEGPASGYLYKTKVDNLQLLPAQRELVSVSMEMPEWDEWQHAFASTLADLATTTDWVVLDTPPGIGTLSIAAAASADLAIVVLGLDHLSLAALPDAMATVETAARTNGRVHLAGFVACKVDLRTRDERMHRKVLNDHYPGKLLAEIPTRVAIRQAAAHDVPLIAFDPSSPLNGLFDTLAKTLQEPHA